MKYIHILGMISVFGWFFSCQKDIEIEITPEAPRLVIYSMLQPDSLASVWVSHSKSVVDARPIQAITNATVIISAGGGSEHTLNLVDTVRGEYQADFMPQPEITYQLAVTAEGYPPIEATTTVPVPTRLSDVNYSIVSANKATEYGHFEDFADTVTRYAFALTFSDPASVKNHYMVSSSLEYLGQVNYQEVPGGDWTIKWDTLTTIAYNNSVDPALRDLEYLTIENPYQGYRDYYFDDQFFSGREYTFNYTSEVDEAFPLNMTVTLTTYHEEAYQYIRTSWNQDYFDYLFYEMIPLAQNIQGGYGIFSSFSQDKVVVKLN